MDGFWDEVSRFYCIIKWIYWSESKSGLLLVNIGSVSIHLINEGSRSFAFFALSTALGNNSKRLQVVPCEWLIALVMCAANLRAQFCDPTYVTTTRSARLCLTSFLKLDIPLQGCISISASLINLEMPCPFQMKKLRHWEVKWASQGHTVNLEYSWSQVECRGSWERVGLLPSPWFQSERIWTCKKHVRGILSAQVWWGCLLISESFGEEVQVPVLETEGSKMGCLWSL